MNIFILDKDPKKAAKQQIDKHIVKMPLESAQMLCTALSSHGQSATPYKPTHKKHPCTIWASQNKANFNWLVEHGIALCEEYTSRYGKRHKCQDVIEWCSRNSSIIPEGGLTEFAQAMPDEYKSKDSVLAYRKYYKGEKSRIATWKQNKPSWY